MGILKVLLQSLVLVGSLSAVAQSETDAMTNQEQIDNAQLVITVHQGMRPQKVTIQSKDGFIEGKIAAGEMPESFPVSTGIGIPVVDDNGMPTQTTTRSGVHKMLWRKIDHKSGQYKSGSNIPASMNFAQFFHSSGQALHETPVTNYKALGRPASHGCVRLRSENAKALWDIVDYYSPEETVVVVEGEVEVDPEVMTVAFQNMDAELMARHKKNLKLGIVEELPETIAAPNQMNIYGRIYQKNSETGVYLPTDTEYTGDYDYKGERGYSGSDSSLNSFFKKLFKKKKSGENKTKKKSRDEKCKEKQARGEKCYLFDSLF